MPQSAEAAKATERQQQVEITLPHEDCVRHGLENAWLRIGKHCEIHVVVDMLRWSISQSMEQSPEAFLNQEPEILARQLQNISIQHGEVPRSHTLEVATSIDGTILIKDSRRKFPRIKGIDCMGIVPQNDPQYQAFLKLAHETFELFAPHVPAGGQPVFETMRASFAQRYAAISAQATEERSCQTI